MKKILILSTLFCMALTAGAQMTELFKPYKNTQLRLPSVPIVVSDPYFSIWSPYDQLTDGSTRHWTNDEKPIDGFLRVDGKTYRFMGTTGVVMKTIIPMADEEAWTRAMTRKKPGKGWEKPGFDDSKWLRAQAAFGSPEMSFVRTKWDDFYSDLYVRRTVELSENDLKGDLCIIYSHDDAFELYINGTRIIDTGNTWREGVKLELTPEIITFFIPARM